MLPAAQAATGFGDSPVFAVDFRNLTGGLAVRGRVLDGSSHQPLTGVSVSLAGQNTPTLADGSYSFANVSQASGNTLNASLTGYLMDSLVVTPPSGASLVTLPDFAVADDSCCQSTCRNRRQSSPPAGLYFGVAHYG